MSGKLVNEGLSKAEEDYRTMESWQYFLHLYFRNVQNVFGPSFSFR